MSRLTKKEIQKGNHWMSFLEKYIRMLDAYYSIAS